jgi:hypothetical protein
MIRVCDSNNKVIAPQPLCFPDLVRPDFSLLRQLKFKLKDVRLETVADIQRELQAALASTKENYFHGDFEAWKE